MDPPLSECGDVTSTNLGVLLNGCIRRKGIELLQGHRVVNCYCECQVRRAVSNDEYWPRANIPRVADSVEVDQGYFGAQASPQSDIVAMPRIRSAVSVTQQPV